MQSLTPLYHLIRFEINYHLRRPVTYVFALLIAGQAVWYSQRLFDYYANDKTFVNSPANMYLVMASFGMAIAVMASILAGQSITKDLDHKVTGYMYSLPMSNHTYLIGKFLGTYITVLLLSLFYPVGVLVLPLFFPDQTGPFYIGPLIDAFVRVVPQNILLVTSMAFALTVFTRRMLGAYLTMLLFMVYFLLMESNREAAFESDLLMLDPFCFGITKDTVDGLSTAEQNTGYLPFADFFIINRLLWLGAALGLLVKADAQFSFQDFVEQPQSRRQSPKVIENFIPQTTGLPVMMPLFTTAARLKQAAWLTWLEFRMLFRQPVAVLSLLAVMLLTVAYAYLYRTEGADQFLLPLTSQITALRHPIGIALSLLLIILTGELSYREQTTRFQLIYDTLPFPAWVTLSAKVLTMVVLALGLSLGLGLAGIGVQLANGLASDINGALYTRDLLLDGFSGFVQRIILTVLITTLIPNRYAGLFVSILVYLLLVTADAVGIGVPVYSFLPAAADYSELTGYGLYAAIQPYYVLLWWLVAGLLFLLALGWQPRGIETHATARIRQWQQRINRPYRLALLAVTIPLLIVYGLILHLPEIKPPVAFTPQNWTPPASQQQVNYTIRTAQGTIPVTIYAQHTYNLPLIKQAITDALQSGSAVLGKYPYPSLTVAEVPFQGDPAISVAGQINLSERRGWFTDIVREGPDETYLLVSRLVFEQWLGTQNVDEPATGLVQHGIAEFLALQALVNRYGELKLPVQMAKHFRLYKKGRGREKGYEPTLAESAQKPYVDIHKASLALHDLGQIWGYKKLNECIGQFYSTTIGAGKPEKATTPALLRQLNARMPDSLTAQLVNFTKRNWFDIQIGGMIQQADGVVFKIIADKWQDDGTGNQTKARIEDWIQVALLDEQKRILSRRELFVGPDEPPITLALQPKAKYIAVDPLGTLPDLNRRNNLKRLVVD
ncbi:ABC transporter permease subunit [Arsenicibacter rosenii]|uniref:Uncharacterized protein n=1 Tax=Arsenicibacter rosenii TaxID=1750698 RepID=A0A1S2VNG5_9BACT|nr:ABC transporter permease subunit [Arsenicibacter rosenii]OIN60317.1 hypothetical protein BLX24_05670 [Arsenicibacter rosenii]